MNHNLVKKLLCGIAVCICLFSAFLLGLFVPSGDKLSIPNCTQSHTGDKLSIPNCTQSHTGDKLSIPNYTQSHPSVIWSNEKQFFAQRNPYYREREALYMVFQPASDFVFLGDSITAKFDWSDAFPGWQVANRGIGSDTTEGILARLDSITALSPRVISLMAGINDLAQGRSPTQIIQTYRFILDSLAAQLPDTIVIVSGILPVTADHTISAESILETNQLLQTLCAEKGIIYLDLFPLFADENRHLKSDYALDNVHLNAQGYLLWLSNLSPVLENLKLTN